MSQATLSERPYVNANLFSGHYLDERVQERDEWDCDDTAHEAMDDLQTLYELEGSLVEGYGEDALIDNWIDEVLDVLGFGTQEEVTLPNGGGFVDELLFETPTARRDAAEVYLGTEDTTDLFERGVGIVEAKQWDAAFNIQFSEQRPYRNASHQTKHYLENTPPNIQWGVLTNGRKWRLYGTNDYQTQTYYEVDLPELLERGDLEAFKYFYVFFRPDAFHESGGTTFLDEVWSESETASQELGENLQDNVFTALRVLGRGFVETNDDLDIDPDDEEALDELKEQSLVFLYRLMFVLYAEARGLIHPEDQRAQDDYEENFSLDALRLEIHEEIGEVDEGFEDEFSTYSTGMWSRLEDLFRLIDQGEEDLGIPPYNGGLFDDEEHTFLTEHEVSNRYLAEVIYRLSTTQNDEGRYVLADYADLDTRHLGSVYEGLLEHQFRIAPEQYAAVAEDGGQVWEPATEVSVAEAVETVPEGGLYVVNDEGERKATGAYYTPDYVVTYIVEETVGPLVEEIREDLIDQGFEPGTQEYIGPFFRRVTDLRILDPAMGSGHFLTKVTGYLSEQMMAEVREAEEEFGVAFDEQHIRREIAKECIYGVDLNGMAVELAKLSMWLETLAADRPLAFLDHHFKQGNSLVGSDIEDIEELESDANDDDVQYSLAEFGATREGTIERLMDIYSEFLAIENETVEDVHEMKRKYAEIEQDELRTRLVAMANVHTAERFGLNVPGGAYERMAKALENDEEWESVVDTDWFASAQTEAESNDFFHWKLAFPEAYYDEEGSLRDDGGFDVVVGNPPYVKIQNLPDTDKEYYGNVYNVARERYDLYSLFVERAEVLSNNRVGLILPNKFFEARAGSPLREYLEDTQSVEKIADFKQNQVFKGATTYTCLLFLSQSHQSTVIDYGAVSDNPENNLTEVEWVDINLGNEDGKWNLTGEKERRLLNKIENTGVGFDEITDQILVGVQTSANDVFVLKECEYNDGYVEGYSSAVDERVIVEADITKPFVTDSEVSRYTPPQTDSCLIYPYLGGGSIMAEDELENQYPECYEYLSENRQGLSERGSENQVFETWYAHWCPRHPAKFERSKIMISQVVKQGESTYDSQGDVFFSSTVYSPILTETYRGVELELLGLLNSSLVWYYITQTGTVLRGGYYRYKTEYLEPISIPVDGFDNSLEKYVRDLIEHTGERERINLNLTDYLGNYSDGPGLTTIGEYNPPEGVGQSMLSSTKEDYENLRVGEVVCKRENESTVVIHATARYKPDDEDAYETDQWGYTETEPMPAMRLTDLSAAEADLVESFVPVAVEKAGGFAGFRETATKTNSLVDRLEAIVLPDPDDVADDLERYREAVGRAEELDKKIQRTDDLIDEIVYDLYGLTEEEIETVEEAVGDD